ncbi:hypothetical protein [Actinoplanes friuliensis]|uniref:Uncharacterized protein n=1 Tax=Actinoplanes friuliensis DSM 7358 TaxID=1246995 RepID=U5VYX3_9ACTN|nr:hypothetical protein [Actinoplanes friuliensis]AGZ42168.1 hypothetical protein AFR_19480 [Actinoplanes friuliensis DSM 7358]
MKEYTAADLTVLYFDESVRRRPAMYFGTDPHLATSVLTALVIASLHPGPKAAPTGPPDVTAEILDDLVLSITDNWPTGPDGSTAGYFGSVLTSCRWVHAAAAAVSTRTTIETWHAGRAWQQTLTGLRPTGPPRDLDAPPGTGTSLTYHLDPSRFAPSTLGALTRDVHAEGCCELPGEFRLHDRRP